jgi:hypothetical protein
MTEEVTKYRRGDRLTRIWPSDELVNISAGARQIAAEAGRAFREALGVRTGQ